MKKAITLFIMACILITCVPLCASAGYEAEYWMGLENCSDIVVGYKTFAIGDSRNGTYTIYDDEFQPVNGEKYIACYSVRDAALAGYDLYRVAADDGFNVFGYVDGTGRTVVPLEYAKVEYLSDRWQYGISIEKSDSTVADFRNSDGSAYIVSFYDIYYRGQKVLRLGRDEFDGVNLSAYALGDYLLVKDLERSIHAYDKTGALSNHATIETTSEYDGWREYTHVPTGTRAFAPGCILTSDEVKQDLMPDGGIYYDLQGNPLNLDGFYSSGSRFTGNYARVERQGKYGLINRQGKEIIPCRFDSERSYDWASQMETYGYVEASLNGKFCYVNAKGEVSYQSPFDESVVKGSSGIIRYVQDLTGEYLLLTPEGGLLSTKYQESPQLFAGNRMCSVKEGDGSVSLIDIYGNTVVNQKAGSSASQYLTGSGNCYFVYLGSRQYAAFKIYQNDSVTVGAGATKKSWICPTCGNENEGKFCGECGTARPS